jgi:four helix bundle protein
MISECGANQERNSMKPKDLKQRTKEFALRIIKLVESLPRGKITDVIGKQLLRSGTSVGANYRSACRAKSTPDFISKMGTVEEETDESIYWMELLIESGMISKDEVDELLDEADQLVAITVSSIKTARARKKRL